MNRQAYIDGYRQKQAKLDLGLDFENNATHRELVGKYGGPFEFLANPVKKRDPNSWISRAYNMLPKDIPFLPESMEGISTKVLSPISNFVPGMSEKMNLANNVLPFSKNRAASEVTKQIQTAAAQGDYGPMKFHWENTPGARPLIQKAVNEAASKRVSQFMGKAAPWALGAAAFGLGGLGLYNISKRQKQMQQQQQMQMLMMQRAMQQNAGIPAAQPYAYRLRG